MSILDDIRIKVARLTPEEARQQLIKITGSRARAAEKQMVLRELGRRYSLDELKGLVKGQMKLKL